jgi:hypothetical protein
MANRLSEIDILFYATAATVIPVLLLADILNLPKVADALSLQTFADNRLRDIRERKPMSLRSTLRFYAWSYGSVVIVALVALPAWAEVECFRALAHGHAGETSKEVVAIGLCVSAAVIVAPLLYKLVVSPATQGIDYFTQARVAKKALTDTEQTDQSQSTS